jgi:hypothetical protein
LSRLVVLPSPTQHVYYLLMNAGMRACGCRRPEDQVDLVVEVFRMLADATLGGPAHHRDVAELATLHPDTTSTADSTLAESKGRRA